jgi:hypothetical protein
MGIRGVLLDVDENLTPPMTFMLFSLKNTPSNLREQESRERVLEGRGAADGF